jgi:hypothetical protein
VALCVALRLKAMMALRRRKDARRVLHTSRGNLNHTVLYRRVEQRRPVAGVSGESVGVGVDERGRLGIVLCRQLANSVVVERSAKPRLNR